MQGGAMSDRTTSSSSLMLVLSLLNLRFFAALVVKESQCLCFFEKTLKILNTVYTNCSQVKNRWAGKTIVDLFAEEFKGRPYDYYVSAVKCGRIQVDGEMVPVSYIVKSSQKISHFLHRHEPPVMAWEVSVLQKEPDVLTVCKPPSVPVSWL
ncbi:hypothetical protein Pint_01233 [Pistacia integerrima]|uniref:Uncharacterized protein n=1 Tax=Pistacia integerrima TaxID=434235 RepID=A0ACC0ZL39_9ROSI|nr:hypothetical protein Pint_01233 [Pistacia integerrima]